MAPSARAPLAATLMVVAASLLACRDSRTGDQLARRVDEGIGRAIRYLHEQQGRDGSWSSRRYRALRGDPALTAMAWKALDYGADPWSSAPERARALAWARAHGPPREVGATDAAGAYPVYTASLLVLALSRESEGEAAALREAWTAELRRHQLAEALGWADLDAAYGGFGYSREPPRRPGAGEPPPPFEADLSSTLFAIGALRVAGVGAEDPAVRKALLFVMRCQNLPLDLDEPRTALDDGGFFFAPTEEVQNKAGRAGMDTQGRMRYRSYGSATADGIRALLRCGLAPTHERVLRARSWLERHWTAERNPGAFPEAREADRHGSHLYYCWSAAHAFRALGLSELETPGGTVLWARDLATELLRRQRQDGSWSNPVSPMMEDDPLVGTPLGLAALSLSRLFL